MIAPDAIPPAPLRAPDSILPQLAAGAIGGVLFGIAPRDRRSGRIRRLLGLALVSLAIEPLVVEAVRRVGDRRRQMVMHSSLDIERNVADVFAFFNDFENFPRIVDNLRSVTDYQDGRSHWEGVTPAGRVMEWDTVITKYVPRSVIAWESTPESEVRMKTVVRFQALSPTRTRVDFETIYQPPHTGIHDAIRAILSPAQAQRMHNDLLHTRDYLESLAPREEEPADPERSSA